MRRASGGPMSRRRLAAHDQDRRLDARQLAPTRRCSAPSRRRAPRPRARHFSSNTPSPRSRRPYSTYARSDSGVIDVERRLRRVRVERLVDRRPLVAPLARVRASGKSSARRSCAIVGEDDRLVRPDARERARPRALRRGASAVAPFEWPHATSAGSPARPRWSTTASASAAKPSHVYASPDGSGASLSPWPRKSNDQTRRPAATSRSATGAQTRPWKPVGCASSAGGPSPPQSCTTSFPAGPSIVCECGAASSACIIAVAVRSPRERARQTVDEWQRARAASARCSDHDVFVIDEPAVVEEAEPVLVLHGFPTSSYDWQHALDVLRARRRVVLLDYPGYGLSAKPDIGVLAVRAGRRGGGVRARARARRRRARHARRRRLDRRRAPRPRARRHARLPRDAARAHERLDLHGPRAAHRRPEVPARACPTKRCPPGRG